MILRLLGDDTDIFHAQHLFLRSFVVAKHEARNIEEAQPETKPLDGLIT